MKSIQHGITVTSSDVNDLNIIHSYIERKLRMKSCIKNKLSTRVKRLHGYCMSRSRAIIKRDLLENFPSHNKHKWNFECHWGCGFWTDMMNKQINGGERTWANLKLSRWKNDVGGRKHLTKTITFIWSKSRMPKI